MRTTIIGLMALLVVGNTQAAMQVLNDRELDAVQGQALITADYTASGNIGFYKVGLQATLDLNMNIRKLQLGCGGINGAGCDIDIDNLSLSGNCTTNRPACDATMTNPFIEFAIKNPGNSSQREITGFRLGSDLFKGLMTAGINDGTANGINTLSGYMQVAASSGKVQTSPISLTNALYGRAWVTVLGIGAYLANLHSDDWQALNANGQTVPFNTPAITLNNSRLTSINMQATSTAPDYYASGEKIAYVDCGLGVCPVIQHLLNYAVIHNVKTVMNINEPLGYVHSIPLNNPFSLSLQKQDILWPGQTTVAKRGWWMSISDPVNLGDMSPPSSYRLDTSQMYSGISSRLNDWLYNHPVSLSLDKAASGVIGYPISVDYGVIDFGGYSPITAALSNLPLGTAQNVTPNCWGSSKFC